MKIKTKQLDYAEVEKLPPYRHRFPKKPNMFFRTLMRVVGIKDLKEVGFSFETVGMEKLGKREPALFIMNHSSFIDLAIATNILYPRPLNIVCTSDGFVGKEWLMRNLGCIPARKFVTDVTLVRDMLYAVKKLKSSILMYPEASYSFDGTETPIPSTLARCIKMLGIAVVMIKTDGAFLRDPLYNMLQKRDVKVSARAEYLISPEETKTLEPCEIMKRIHPHFTFDNFREQQKKKIKVDADFRADGLNRVLYKCPFCLCEEKMQGKGTKLKCNHCGKEWELTEYGFIKATDGDDKFTHIPDWYKWERRCVHEELENGSYRLDVPVEIKMMVDMKNIYEIGEGRLIHDRDGFHLTGADGRLNYHHRANASYSLYSDYYWYELGDMICVGNTKALYYCFPKTEKDIVAKTRLASEELYKLDRENLKNIE